MTEAKHVPCTIVAIDQGTTSTRAVLVNENGDAKVIHSVKHQQQYPASGWVEHDATELLSNIKQCIAKAGKVDAVAIANQGESCLAWDGETKMPLSPVIVWQDNRTHEAVCELKERGGEALTLARAGLPLDPYFSASKFRWLLDNNRDVKRAAENGTLRIGTTDAFFLDSLTGVFATDLTTASRTSLFNIHTKQWDPELCELFGVPVSLLPEVKSSAGNFGCLADGTPVNVSMVDQQASLYGHNCTDVGDTKITFGTGAFVLMSTGNATAVVGDDGLLSTIAWATKDQVNYAVEGGVYNASSALEWVKQIGLFSDYSELAWFEKAPAIARHLAFVPALSGLAAPYWDRTASGLWIGMESATEREDMCQSVLEGVALRAAQVVAAMSDKYGAVHKVSIDGGLSRSPYFCQFLADILQCKVVTWSFDELTAYGCAALSYQALTDRALQLNAQSYDYFPKIEKALSLAWQEKFKQAVLRSQGWR